MYTQVKPIQTLEGKKTYIPDYLFDFCADTSTMYILNVLNNIFNLSFL